MANELTKATSQALDPSTAQATSHAEAMVKAQYVMAQQYPRDEAQVRDRIMKLAGEDDFAEEALYRYPRGGSMIEGISVYASRAMAQAYGNIETGYRVVSRDENFTYIEGVAWDFERNMRAVVSMSFQNLIQRKRNNQTVWVKPEERERRELEGKHGAIASRNAMLQVIPEHWKKQFTRVVKDTIESDAGKKLERDRKGTVQRMLKGFAKYGVTEQQVTKYIGCPVMEITAPQLRELYGIGNSLRQGQSTPDEFFAPVEAPKPAAAADKPKPKGGAVPKPPPYLSLASVDLTETDDGDAYVVSDDQLVKTAGQIAKHQANKDYAEGGAKHAFRESIDKLAVAIEDEILRRVAEQEAAASEDEDGEEPSQPSLPTE